jgi:hypothetical protein
MTMKDVETRREASAWASLLKTIGGWYFDTITTREEAMEIPCRTIKFRHSTKRPNNHVTIMILRCIWDQPLLLRFHISVKARRWGYSYYRHYDIRILYPICDPSFDPGPVLDKIEQYMITSTRTHRSGVK